MNYLIALLAVLAVVFSVVSFPVPAAIGIAIAGVWWLAWGRRRGVDRDIAHRR